MGKSYKAIEVNWAKIVSRCWKVTEASALHYFESKKWTRNIESAKVEESGNEIVFRIKGGDFAKLERLI